MVGLTSLISKCRRMLKSFDEFQRLARNHRGMLPPCVDPQTFDAAGLEGLEGGGLDEGA